MEQNKKAMPEGKTYKEIAEFWDNHPVTDYWNKTKAARFRVDIKSEHTYFKLDGKLSKMVLSIARAKRISPRRLLHRWVREKALQER